MDRLTCTVFTAGMEQTDDQLAELAGVISRRSFCTLATVSQAHRPHVAGVLYEAVGTTL